ncbi:MAG TPA: diguanylate cyclase [Xanthomonadaceae bacterium]|nr:diguanylate cyclase [Xanthomonadaceae bacterium]
MSAQTWPRQTPSVAFPSGGSAAMLLAVLISAAAGAHPEELIGSEAYGPAEGLSQLTVTAIVEDDRGFLWVGTQEGLNRFDGHRFTVFRREADGRGLVSSSIDALAFDAHRRLWLGTNDAGLEVIHLPSGKAFRLSIEQGLSHRRVRRILVEAGGSGWVLTDAGVDRIDTALETVTRVGAMEQGVALQRAGASGQVLALDDYCRLFDVGDDGLRLRLDGLGETIRCVGMHAGDEDVRLATAEHGLFRVTVAGEIVERLALDLPQGESGPLRDMGHLRDGSLILGWESGAVRRIDPVAGQFSGWTLRPEPGSAITTSFQDSSGTLWIGTYTAGLHRVLPLSGMLLADETGRPSAAVWPSSSVRAIWRDGDTTLVGTDGGLVYRRGHGAWSVASAFTGLSVRVLLKRDSGDWLVGTHGGLFTFDIEQGGVSFDGLPDPRIDDIVQAEGSVWIATRGGLARLRDDGRQVEPVALQGVFVTSLLADGKGGVWAGTNDRGLWQVAADGSARRFELQGEAPLHDSVWALHGDGDRLWVGTFSGGLYRVDLATRRARVYTDADGLSNNVIYRILEDRHARLWLSTNHGLSVLDTELDIIQTLGRRDGLQNQEFNSGSGFRSADGLLLFGGTRGLDVVDPAQLARRSPPARPVLTGLRVIGRHRDVAVPADRGTDIAYRERLDLDFRDSVLSFAMTAIDFTAPGAARVRYRMHGLHEEWVNAQAAQAEASFSFLAPGNYRLEVAAAGRDGRFGEARVLLVNMPPPPWRHPLAYAAYLLAALLLAAWLISRVGSAVRRERAQVERLNREVAERTEQLEHANRLLRQSNQQLDIATRRDPLTRVSNRRDLHDWLARECPLVQEEIAAGSKSSGLVFFMIDIDNFKGINDDFGHRCGDAILVAVADRLRGACRERDLLVRWGGEEFMLVARDFTVEEAVQLAEHIRHTVAHAPVEFDADTRIDLTASIGFAPWPFAAAWPALGDWEQTVHLADRALYAAKAAGKNAWVGVVPGGAPDRPAVQALLSGGEPGAHGERCARVVHSTAQVPVFPR